MNKNVNAARTHGRSLFSIDKSYVLSPYMISIHSEKYTLDLQFKE